MDIIYEFEINIVRQQSFWCSAGGWESCYANDSLFLCERFLFYLFGVFVRMKSAALWVGCN